ncbi:hypothetical protein ABE137_24995 [Brevibacillus laterosporus]|uniref:Uncharacterized protein n=2 Tax=Brevibacillus TaxID=55080 RepID=A0A0F7EFK5_BRELA|nr:MULTISPECIES: hypothetical protein [Brevibacillus]AKF93298.1 hypothetical protein EX87_06275 [Brevibacillus laterosporus]MCR8987506.1 hypothetical protein [Brevibacillus laterosporus]MCZ0833244.1 hypothetical protein [Brevibacillus halotolerans]
MADIVSNLLSKLSERTGREWSIHDIYRLAQKLPEVNNKNITSVLNEISDMGLNVSQEARDKVLNKVKNKDYTGIKNEVLNHPVEEVDSPIECSLDKKEKKAKNKSSKRTKGENAKIPLHKKSSKSSKSLYHSLKKLSNKKGKKKRV